MDRKMNYVINNKTSLEKLENDKSLKQKIRKIKIELDSSKDFSNYERQINRHYFSCGCETGSFTVLATLIVGYFLWANDVAPTIWVWWKVLIILVLSSLFGKIVGLLISHMKFRRLLRELSAFYSDS